MCSSGMQIRLAKHLLYHACRAYMYMYMYMCMHVTYSSGFIERSCDLGMAEKADLHSTDCQQLCRGGSLASYVATYINVYMAMYIHVHVQFGCCQHKYKWMSSSPIYVRLSLWSNMCIRFCLLVNVHVSNSVSVMLFSRLLEVYDVHVRARWLTTHHCRHSTAT